MHAARGGAQGELLRNQAAGLFPFWFLRPFSARWFRLELCSVEEGQDPSSLLLLLGGSTLCLAVFQGSEVSALGLVKLAGPMAPLGASPRLVLLFSGKRKSGKDFVTERLQSRCPRGQGSRGRTLSLVMEGLLEGAR